MNYWLLADPHFGHDKMIKDGLQKKGYEDKIFHSLIHNIEFDDIFICLGDVAFYNTPYWHAVFLNKIRAKKKFLIIGNHDRETMSAYYRYGWNFVAQEFKIKIYGKTILFSHSPVVDRIDFDINIHGHLHDDNHRGASPLLDNQRLVYTELITLKNIIGK